MRIHKLSDKRKRNFIYIALMIISMLVLLLIVICYYNFADSRSKESADRIGRRGTALNTDELELKLVCSGQYERIKVWRKGSGEDNDGKKYDSNELYAFLPAGTEIDNVSFFYNDKKVTLLFNNREYVSGEAIDTIELKEQYELIVDGNNGKEINYITFVQSKNLPVAFITTKSGSTAELRQDKSNREEGTFKLIDIDGSVQYDGKLEWISGRGNSSWSFEKRPYMIKLIKEADLLGMGAAKKWVLFANAFDDSNGIRNQMAYWLAQQSGLEYSCELKFIDLYINEVYAGTYQLCEKIEIHKNRMNIGYLDEANEKLNPGLDSLDGTYKDSVGLDIKTPDDYSGGYILERNYGSKLTEKPFYFTTESNEGFVIRAPSKVSNKEMAYIKKCMQTVENAILAKDGTDPVSGMYYTELIDLESWAKKFLINVVTKGESIGNTSSYFYKKAGDNLIYAGPAWDFDKSFARQQGISSPYILMDNIGSTVWWENVYNKSEFYDKVVQCYYENFRPYMKKLTEKYIVEWTDYIADSSKMNWLRWPEAEADYEFPTNPTLQEGEGSAAYYLCNWLTQRTEYLDSLWQSDLSDKIRKESE